jgi:phosphoribosylanthranilate isomerase
MRVKICGITQIEGGKAIAKLGATALGFICVAASPRYVAPAQIKAIIAALPPGVDCIGVFADAAIVEIVEVVQEAKLTGVQLHGDESPSFCQEVRDELPGIEIIKALRLRNAEELLQTQDYMDVVDTLLLDAYHPQMLGGTGTTIDWEMLREFRPATPWILAGGLTPENVCQAIEQVSPNGIDLSSGVERSPGDKDLNKVAQLFDAISLTSDRSQT